MKGYPKYLNTKEDYLYVQTNFPKDKWMPSFQALLDDRMKWMQTGKLFDPSEGIEDDTHKIIKMEDAEIIEYYQYEFREDPNCKLLRLGFTVEEVEGYLVG